MVLQDIDGGMTLMNCYKVDYNNLNEKWTTVSNDIKISTNDVLPVIDIVNKKMACFRNTDQDQTKEYCGFFYYKSDPEVRELIGLLYDGKTYRRIN